MDSTTFTEEAKSRGFEDIAEKIGAPNSISTPHTHPFAVRGLVTSGEFILTKAGTPSTYHPGDIFEMDALCEHTEASGAKGSVYLVSRKPAG